jgi:hypothetical protein
LTENLPECSPGGGGAGRQKKSTNIVFERQYLCFSVIMRLFPQLKPAQSLCNNNYFLISKQVILLIFSFCLAFTGDGQDLQLRMLAGARHYHREGYP